MQQRFNLIGILGGTFDPIHHGHLRLALELTQQLPLAEMRFIPCREPVHRDPTLASAKQRWQMLTLAIKDQAKFIADDREINRNTPSYMFDTLTSLRQELSDDQHLCLILGVDALNNFTKWYKWQDILTLCHIIAVERPDWLSHHMPDVLRPLLTTDIQQLQKQSAGLLLLRQTTALQISSSAIRAQLNHKLSPRYLLPEAVLNYIYSEKLYIPFANDL